jgi:hypothetical protein
MSFASVYPMYLAKVEKKGRTRDELHEVIKWLTGFDDRTLQGLIAGKATFETFCVFRGMVISGSERS